MTDYRVGQILYIIPAETANVVPVLVTERRISETVTGTAIKHIVKSPKPKAQPMVLETIKGLIFADLRTARETMVQNATQAIDAMVRHAQNVAQQAFGPKEAPQPQIMVEDDPFDTTGVLIDDEPMPMNGGGRHALPAPVQPDPSPAVFAASDISDDGTTEVMLPNGQKQRVRIKPNN